jgi:hypothetical protein
LGTEVAHLHAGAPEFELALGAVDIGDPDFHCSQTLKKLRHVIVGGLTI